MLKDVGKGVGEDVGEVRSMWGRIWVKYVVAS